MNIHRPNHRLRLATEKLRNDDEISMGNKTRIIDFLDYLLADGLSECRVMKYLYVLKRTSKIIKKDFFSVNKKDATQFFKYINTNEEMAEWTKHDYKIMVRRFYEWIGKENEDLTADLKKTIEYISSQEVKRAKSREKRPEHLLTPEEVMKIADKTKNSRDRAFTLTFYESACRIGELLPTKIKDLKFDKYGLIINVDGKTGPRPVRICAAAPAVSNWLTNHPDRENPDAFLFCGIGRTNYMKMLSYASSRKIIFEAAKKAGIKKRVNLHKFRASRATQLVLDGMSEPVLCDFGGWVIGSDEIRTYVRLSGKNVDNELLRINGVRKEDEIKHDFKIMKCPRCGIKNSPGAKYCGGCSLGLDEKSVMEYDKQKERSLDTGRILQKGIQKEQLESMMRDTLLKMLKEDDETLRGIINKKSK